MPVYDFSCKCGVTEAFVRLNELHQFFRVCEKCGEEMKRLPVAVKSYKWNCDNGASITPSKFRGGEE